jgi:hypothetical protein
MSRAVKAPAADDMRVGVTPAEHRVLERVEEMRDNQWSQFAHLERAIVLVKQAKRTTDSGATRRYAEEAAAHLLRVAELGEGYLAALRALGADATSVAGAGDQ